MSADTTNPPANGRLTQEGASASRPAVDMPGDPSFWNGRRALVTGATGTVGSWLVKDLLALGARVVALVRDADPQSELYRSGDINRISVVNGRLESYDDLERAINEHETDVVFHLGAQTIVGTAHRSPLATFEANIRGTYNLLEACRVHRRLVERVVVASSDKAYGTQPVLPYTEDMSLTGEQPYEVSKSCTDLLSRSYFLTYGLPVTVARCGNIFGGGDLNWSRIIPGTVRSYLRGERPIIRSDGTFIRDYIYVRDVSQAYLLLAEKTHDGNAGEAFNFSPERALNVLELVGEIQRLMGHEDLEPDIRASAQGEIHSQYLNSSKAAERLGWAPRYSLDAGLNETIEWYRQFFAEPTLNQATAR
jgi:CDP-glucose 4,6-dehydratase